jgi:hypothetical protein
MASRFDYIRYDETAQRKQAALKLLFQQVESFAESELPPSRERSLLITELEVAYMWAGKAIRDDQVQRGGPRVDVAERG